MYTIEGMFVDANVYSTGATADGYSFITGTGTGAVTDGYKLLAFSTINNTGSTLYALCYDGYTASVAASGPPIASLQIPANLQASYAFGVVNQLLVAKNGIMIAYSSTPWSFTPVVTAAWTTAWWI